MNERTDGSFFFFFSTSVASACDGVIYSFLPLDMEPEKGKKERKGKRKEK